MSFGSPPPWSRSGLGFLGTFQPALPCGISFIHSVHYLGRYYIRYHDTKYVRYYDTFAKMADTILRPDDVNHAALLDHAGPQVFFSASLGSSRRRYYLGMYDMYSPRDLPCLNTVLTGLPICSVERDWR